MWCQFDDIPEDSPTWIQQGYVPPNERVAYQLGLFIRKHWESTIIVHCAAGVSRSAAVAGVLVQLGWEPYSWPTPFYTAHANPLLTRLLKQEFKKELPNVY